MTEVERSNGVPAKAEIEPESTRKRWPWILLAALFFAIASLVYWWFAFHNKVTTDNAYVVADSAMISPKVPGTIAKINVDNDDSVRRGDILVQLDPSDYDARVEEARAALRQIRMQIQASMTFIQWLQADLKASVAAAKAALQKAVAMKDEAAQNLRGLQSRRLAALAEYRHAKRDFERFSHLLKAGAAAARDRDRTKTAFAKAKSQLESLDASIDAARAQVAAVSEAIHAAKAALGKAESQRIRISSERYRLRALKAQENQAKAQLKLARLQRSYCTIRSPISGYIAEKRIQVGQQVRPGQPLFAVVPLRDVYVEANFKETQLTDVCIGQPAEIKADIYPHRTFQGRVVGIRAGTGSSFSLLPAENATGNWIKVVQRVPVRIRLDEPPPPRFPLRVGLSLEVTVDTSRKDGPKLLPPQPRGTP